MRRRNDLLVVVGFALGLALFGALERDMLRTLRPEEARAVPAAIGQIRAWRENPVLFVREVFHAEPDPWQVEILQEFPHRKRMALSTCVSPGKTALEAWLGWNFLATRPQPRVAFCAITTENLGANLWPELGKWRARSVLLQQAFEYTTDRIYLRTDPKCWYGEARSWNRSADPDVQGMTLAGLHEDYAAIFFDEAGGFPDAVVAAAEGVLASGVETHLILAGNPTHLSGALYRALTNERPLWFVREITGDPDDPNRAPRVKVEWAREMIQKYGRDSAWVQVRVFGKPPKASTDALVSLSDFEDAFTRYTPTAGEEAPVLAASPRTLGLDVARYGTDQNVCYFRAGDTIHRRESWGGQSTTYTAGRVAGYAREWEADMTYVDDVGLGGGVTDQLEAAGIPVVGVNTGEASLEPEMNLNLRAELNCALADRFRTGAIAINPTIRDTTTLVAQGTTLKVGYTTAARRKVESKDEYKKRTGGDSPDDWDALVLAFADRAESHRGLMSVVREHAAAKLAAAKETQP